MINSFIAFLNSIHPLSDEASKALQSIISVQRFPKNSILLSEGQVLDRLYFLCEGLARAFYFDNHQEFTSWILPENEFIISPYSFSLQKPSFETIQLLEDSVVITIERKDLESLYKSFPEITYVSLKITEGYLLLYDERTRSLRLSAEERFIRFQNQYPRLLMRLQVQHIASFLGLSRSRISFLRNKVK